MDVYTAALEMQPIVPKVIFDAANRHFTASRVCVVCGVCVCVCTHLVCVIICALVPWASAFDCVSLVADAFVSAVCCVVWSPPLVPCAAARALPCYDHPHINQTRQRILLLRANALSKLGKNKSVRPIDITIACGRGATAIVTRPSIIVDR